MNRSAAGEAQRQVALAETLYKRLVEKNRKAEQAYRTKIETLKAAHAELQQTEGAATQGSSNGTDAMTSDIVELVYPVGLIRV